MGWVRVEVLGHIVDPSSKAQMGLGIMGPYINNIKFCSIICSTFKQKEKAQKKKIELKSEKRNCNIASPTDPKEKKAQRQS